MQSKRALFAGDAVMAKLVAISKQFCFRNSDASSGTELLEAVSKVVSKKDCGTPTGTPPAVAAAGQCAGKMSQRAGRHGLYQKSQ